MYFQLKEKRGKSSIWITFEDAGRDIVIQVKDDGIGMTEDRLREVQEGLKNNQSVGFGMSAVEGRLKLYYGEDAVIYFENVSPSGVKVHLFVPLQEEQKDEDSSY